MENQSTQNLAEKIALLLTQKDDDNFVRSSLEKINQRLDAIETQIKVESRKSKVQSPKYNHYSQEKFLNLEELADEVIDGSPNEKACPYEPTGKPCDNCSMCNSRGF